MYQIEYRLDTRHEWLKAGPTFDDRQHAIADYYRKFEDYRNKLRRLVKITTVEMRFDIILKESN